MTNISERKVAFDERLSSYEAFFDGQWGVKFLTVTENTKLQDAAFDLLRNWEYASTARSIPWIMIHCLRSAEDGMIQRHEPVQMRTISMMTEKLVSRLMEKQENVRPMLRQKLQEAVSEIHDEAVEVLARAKQATSENREDTWELLLAVEDFSTSLWMSERTWYASLYYNYECFLMECVKIHRGEAKYRVRPDEFKRHFREAFGEQLRDFCWSDSDVNIARLARNALAHNGGRITDDLKKQNHPFEILGEEIQIYAPQTTALYHLLKDRGYRIAEVATALSEFQVPKVD